jgi:vancomycin resistance protein YoaR
MPATVRRWLLPAVLLALLVVVGGLFLADRALAGSGVPEWVRLAGVDFERRDDASVRAAIAEAARRLEVTPLNATAGSDNARISAKAIAYDLDEEATFRAVAEAGHAGPLASLRATVGWKPDPVEVAWVASHDSERLAKEIAKLAKRLDRAPRNAGLSFTAGEVTERTPRSGRRLRQDVAKQQVEAVLVRPGTALSLPFEERKPAVGSDGLADAAERARGLLDGPVTISVAGETVSLSPERLSTALKASVEGSRLDLSIDTAKMRTTLGPQLEPHEVAPVDASFTVSGGKVRRTPAKAGKRVDMNSLADDILSGQRAVDAVLTESQPKLTTAEADKLGIKQRISTFTTNFPAGQPRVRNIARATQILQDTLIMPGERFSLNKAIGPRTSGRGFVEAPAIFKGEFVKDVGGGVSQVATTFFNAVFFAGREFNEFKAHSYYISRYPLGREATISSPWPDLAFTNDSKYGILVRTRTTSTSVTISFYSTPDGRTVKAEGPEILAKRPRGVEYVTDPEKVGEGHDGYDVVVYRVITRPGQAPERERYFTRYDVDNTKILKPDAQD